MFIKIGLPLQVLCKMWQYSEMYENMVSLKIVQLLISMKFWKFPEFFQLEITEIVTGGVFSNFLIFLHNLKASFKSHEANITQRTRVGDFPL